MCAFILAQFPKEERWEFSLDDYPELKKQVESCDKDIDAAGSKRSKPKAALGAQTMRQDDNVLGRMCDSIMSVMY